jgi:hypothetical protein
MVKHKAGDCGMELINQGMRECTIVAVLGDRYLYEYVMPNGTSTLRNERGKSVSYSTLSQKWVQAIAEQFGLIHLYANPQQGTRGANLLKLLESKVTSEAHEI